MGMLERYKFFEIRETAHFNFARKRQESRRQLTAAARD